MCDRSLSESKRDRLLLLDEAETDEAVPAAPPPPPPAPRPVEPEAEAAHRCSGSGMLPVLLRLRRSVGWNVPWNHPSVISTGCSKKWLPSKSMELGRFLRSGLGSAQGNHCQVSALKKCFKKLFSLLVNFLKT